MGLRALVIATLIAGFFVLAFVSQLAAARRDLSAARADLLRAKQLVVARDDAGARAAIASANNHLRHARSVAGSLPLALTEHVPLLGTPARAVSSASAAGLDVVDAANSVVDAADALPTKGEKGIDGHDLSQFHSGALQSAAKLQAADGQLAQAAAQLDGPAGAWLPPISDQAAAMRTVVTSTRNDLAGAQRGLTLLKDLTDPATDARLLLLSQDSMELRPTGGFIGSYGVLHFSHGTVKLEDFHATEDLAEPSPPLTGPGPLATIDWPYDIRSSNWWPDFPTSAQTARDLFRVQGGGEVDGVIAITQPVLGRLIGAIGPQTIPGYAQPVVEQGLQDRILYEIEQKQPQDVPRKRFLELLSKQVFDQLFNLPASKVPAVVTAIDDSVAIGDIQAWFVAPEREQLVEGTAWSGRLPVVDGDFLMIVDADIAGITDHIPGKAGRDVTRDATYQVKQTGDHYAAHLEVTWRNQGAPSKLNMYYGGYIRVYVPRGATLLSTTDSIHDEGLATDGPYRVFSARVHVLPGQQQTIAFDYSLPLSVVTDGHYALTWIRQTGTERDSLEATVPGASGTAPEDRRIFRLG